MSSAEFPKKALFICNGSKCSKDKEIRKYFKTAFKENGLHKSIEIFKIECSGRCKQAPIVCIQPQNIWYEKVDVAIAKKIMHKI
jgi:NADH:ubiquinone oxidoreductase subunit E